MSQVKVLVHSGKVAATIVSTARHEGSDLIVLTVDRCTWAERLRHLFFGSVTTWVERHAPCLVLVLSIWKDVPLPIPPASNLRHTKSLGRHLAQAA